MEFPFAGSRMLLGLLVQEGFKVGRLHVATLIKRRGRAGKRHGFERTREGGALPQAEHLETGPGAQDIPLSGSRKLPIIRPNQVWAMDITYIPMARGFVYLTAVVDWFSRRVLAWRLSITLEVAFCLEALHEALARHGRPEIFNTDQSLPPRRRGAANSPAETSPTCCGSTASPSAWTARAPGATMSSSSGSGAR